MRHFWSRAIAAFSAALMLYSVTAGNIAAAAAATDTAVDKPKPMKQVFAERLALMKNMEAVTGIPWHMLAAVDQYERSLSIANPKTRPPRQGLVGIYIPEPVWVGPANPNLEDTDIRTVSIFGGIGKDGTGDGKADLHDDIDVLFSFVRHLLRTGISQADMEIALMRYYQNERAVKHIKQFAKIYSQFGTLDLHKHVFPLPIKADYSYRSTWGVARNFGGYRIHEGTDLFANYGVPVRSTAYGVIEVRGWNKYGGWRVGIRDLNNVYHYYAHLSGFNKKLKEGDVVSPGDVVGWVGSSGYGRPGTSGKFPPHLHYGLYRDNGRREWSFDPYPYLRRWEREERLASKRKAPQ